MYLADISGVLLFQRSVYSDRFWLDCPYFERALLVFIKGAVSLWNKHLQSSLLSNILINLSHLQQPSIPWETLIPLQNNNFSHTFFQIYHVFSSKFRQRSIIVYHQPCCLLGCRHVFIWRLVYYLMMLFTTIHFFYATVIIPREYFN